MKNDKLIGILLIVLGILGGVSRIITKGYNNLWDFIMLLVFIVTIIIGILWLKKDKKIKK